MSHNYWLFKSEGSSYNIDDLKKDQQTSWTGVRNYQARNFMMKDVKVNDVVLFYHSGGDSKHPSGIYGLAKVCTRVHVDETQYDKKDDHFDSKATKEKPIWYCVGIKFVKKLTSPITLTQIKFDPKLEGMQVREVGSRLSVQPVSLRHGTYLVGLSK
jgi:predicted RNA-binding protein with PUA-like domain